MNIMIIGANGRQGSNLCRVACDRGHEVTAVIRDGLAKESRVSRVLHKNLFDITKRDIEGCDVIISAFGSGFEADPSINREAIDRLINLVSGTQTRLLIVGGSGSLYSDDTHAKRVWELPEHPVFLREISKYLAMGLDDLFATSDISWTYVTPSLNFDYTGKPTGHYKIGTDMVPLFNRDGISRITYADYALAMIDEAESGAHDKMCITVCEI